MRSFNDELLKGQAGESMIANWLRENGCSVMPVYEKIFDTGKGPQLFTPYGTLIAPDLLVFRDGVTRWIEAKHKSAFSWHRITERWVTGIDLRHYEDYLKVDEISPFEVWLLFLHEGGQAKDSPANSPRGLYGERLSYLRNNENHRSDKHGSSGMVYWGISSLKKLATLKNVERADQNQTEIISV